MGFIVIEGLDGSGKSTQIRLLRSWFEENNLPYYFLHFPRTQTGLYGNLIASFLRGDMGKLSDVDPYLVAMLYAGDRKDAAPLIREALGKKETVLVDRYVFSNIAFQCAKFQDKSRREQLKNWILDLEYNHFSIPKPDITLFLDVPFSFTTEKLTLNRKGSEREYLKGSHDIHEKDLSFQQQVAHVYQELVTSGEMHAITCYDTDGQMLPKHVIFEKISSFLEAGNLF